jgi:hypothetical protein
MRVWSSTPGLVLSPVRPLEPMRPSGGLHGQEVRPISRAGVKPGRHCPVPATIRYSFTSRVGGRVFLFKPRCTSCCLCTLDYLFFAFLRAQAVFSILELRLFTL